jgi:hypothetical protein
MILLVIFGIIVLCFGGSYLLFKIIDRHGDPRKKKSFWILSCTSTILLSLASPYILLFAALFQSGTSERPFDSARWQNIPDKRTEMVDDLIEKQLLDNLTEDQVIELLGEPLKDNPYFVSTGRDMIYHLGQERNPLGVDSEWLLVWLDDNKVSKYKLMTD